MQIIVGAVGRWKDCPEQAIWQEYSRRLSWQIVLKEVEIKQHLPLEKRKAAEAEKLLALVPKGAAIIALDEHGKVHDSPAFAKIMGGYHQDARDIVFLIGGADGHDEAVLKAAERRLSLGAMTWPHLLVRAMLAEQIYRAHTILSGHPYHRI